MWPQKENSKCRVLLAEQTIWSDVLCDLWQFMFLSLNYKIFTPAVIFGLGPGYVCVVRFIFVFVLAQSCGVEFIVFRISGLMQLVCVCVFVWIQHLNLLEVGTNSHSLTLVLFLCDTLYMNSQWMLPSARPDQIVLCRKKEQKHHSKSRERTRHSEREIDKEARQRREERTQLEQSYGVGLTLLLLNC